MNVPILPYNYTDSTVWSGPAVFERIQHFKDCGVPGTVNDLFNQYAIADGSCRAVGYAGCGCSFLKHPDRVRAIIEAIKGLPSSDGPSNLVLTAQNGNLLNVCNSESTESTTLEDYYDPSVVSSSIQNWWRALCSKDFTPFDPAYQPQQQAVTLGFLCNTACNANGEMSTGDFLNQLNMDIHFTAFAVDQMCTTQNINFEPETTFTGIAAQTEKLMGHCGCAKDGDDDAILQIK